MNPFKIMCPPYSKSEYKFASHSNLKPYDLCDPVGSDWGLFKLEVVSTCFMVISILHIKNQSIAISKSPVNNMQDQEGSERFNQYQPLVINSI